MKPTKTVPFTFDELYNETNELLEKLGFDVSPGSNTSQLSAVMSYLIASLNTNTALNINETLLPYANKRKNILQDARVLGYEAIHKTSYIYKLTILISDEMTGYGQITIPKYFEVEANGHTYYYCNDDIKINLGELIVNNNYISPSDITFSDNKCYYEGNDVTNLWKNVKLTFEANKKIELIVKEGKLITYDNDTASLVKTIDSISVNDISYIRNYIDIPYTDIENDGIECLVSYTDNDGILQENVKFSKTNDYFFENDGNDKLSKTFLRLDDIEMGTPRIYFKYAGMGSGIPLNSVVKLNVLQTSGTDGSIGNLSFTESNGNLSFSGITLNDLASDNSLISNVFSGAIIIGCDEVQSGTSEESNQSIKENAPKVYNSAYRLITNLDYKSACNRSTYVKDSVVWGGESEFPKAPGHIWFSFLPEKSERSFSFNNARTLFQRDNSKLLYNYQEGETKYQHELRQRYYQKNYLLNSEIKSYDKSTGKYTGVWGELEGKFVPSLTFHHRHPLYMNFDYTFNILKYNIKDDTTTIHQELFDIIDRCFNDEESLNLERFDTEYFHTNIVKRLDTKISDLCGFTSSLSTQIILNEKTCCTENWISEYKDIYIPLCVPFEKYFNSRGFLDTSRLPKIDTPNFIDYRFDTIKPPVNEYPYEGIIVNKYSHLAYSVVSGDLYVDWSKIKNDQTQRANNYGDNDLFTKLFVAPVKIDMTYKYYCGSKFMNGSDNYIQLGFMVAPSNTADEIYDNIKVTIYNQNYNPDVSNTGNKVEVITDFNSYFSINDEHRDRLYFDSSFKQKLQEGYVLEINFKRTCGYYYLFNGYKKEILVHLFVNGDSEGFTTASTGIRHNEYYEHFLDELMQTWERNEEVLSDDDMFIGITYTSPRSYLYTSDRRYLVSIEPTGKELEKEKHLYNYDQYGMRSDTEDDREDEEEGGGLTKGHYLTTEGYLIDEEGTLPYTGPIVKNYNENMYKYTPLKLDLFKQNVYMNVKYNSENFKVQKNVIPRLNSVRFKNAVEVY